MTSTVEQNYIVELGRVLRARRGGRSRNELLSEIPPGETQWTVPTYTTWEQGTRMIPLGRLVLLAPVLGATPGEILAEVDRAVFRGTTVDLVALAELTAPEVGYVARWARASVDRGYTSVRLSSSNIGRLAEVGEIPPDQLAHALGIG